MTCSIRSCQQMSAIQPNVFEKSDISMLKHIENQSHLYVISSVFTAKKIFVKDVRTNFGSCYQQEMTQYLFPFCNVAISMNLMSTT